QVLVSWAPSNANGAIVTRYNVTANPGGATCVAVGSTQCYVNALTNGTPYTFTVTATNLHGTSAASAPSAPIAPAGVPSAPTNVVGVYGDQQVTVAWTAANGGGLTVDAYDVVVYIQGVPQPSLGCSTTGALSCIVTGLTNGQAYTFGVIATNVIGQSQESFPSGFVTPSGKPFAVTNVGVSRTSTTATITWTPGGSNGLAIRSYTATASNGAECINIVGIDAPNTCTITGLTAGAAYTFSVKANNLNGDSPLTAVGAPSAVSAVRGDHEVTVSWTAAAGGDSAAVSYVVTSTPESKTCTTLSTDVSATSCKITGLTNGTQYSFAVVAVDGAGHRIAASPVTATPAGLPFRATGVGVTRSGTSATISWTASNENGATVTGYTVTASPSGKTCTTTDLTSCTITGLDLLTAYSFTVVATNAVGDSLGKVLAAPSNFVVTRGDHEVTISWTAPAGGESAAVGYTVTADSEGKGCTTASTDVAPTSCTITGLTNGKAYTFTLVATDGLGQTAEAPAVTVTPAGLPFVLAKPTAVFGKASATVSWSAGDGNGDAITKYTVTSTPGGFTCETSGTSCVVTGLTNGTEYTFAVTATNTVGTNAASVSSDAVTPGAVPEAPALTSVVAGDHKVTLVWGNAEPNGRALTGYKVTSNDPNFHCETAANVNTCVIAGLTNGSKYTFTVLATNSLGDGAGAVSAETVPYGKATAVTSAKVNGVVKGKFLVIGVKGAKSNGSAITSYKVKYAYGTSKTFSAWKTIKANGIFNVVGWPKGSTIKFQVASVNAAGQTFSKIFTLKTPTK
ncbi:MAG: hypothetical protein RL441_659, partial [Actinomycetota bacterium]